MRHKLVSDYFYILTASKKVGGYLLLLLLVASSSHAAKMFRTPSRLLGDRFTVKVLLKQGTAKYIVPFWVDPDSKTSSLDEKQMREYGWKGESHEWEEVSVSGHVLPTTHFKNEDNEEAFLPDYYKSCCVGKIGKDILSHYQVVAFDDMTAYIEWFEASPSSWFTRERKYKWPVLDRTLFLFSLVPPKRLAVVSETFTEDGVTIPKGAEWVGVQDKIPRYLDKYLLIKYLKGRVDPKIKLEFKVGKIGEIRTIVHEFK